MGRAFQGVLELLNVRESGEGVRLEPDARPVIELDSYRDCLDWAGSRATSPSVLGRWSALVLLPKVLPGGGFWIRLSSSTSVSGDTFVYIGTPEWIALNPSFAALAPLEWIFPSSTETGIDVGLFTADCPDPTPFPPVFRTNLNTSAAAGPLAYEGQRGLWIRPGVMVLLLAANVFTALVLDVRVTIPRHRPVQ